MARKSNKTQSIHPSEPDDKWRARSAIDTLTRAEEIRRDKPLMRAVKAEAKRQQSALSKVAAPTKRGR